MRNLNVKNKIYYLNKHLVSKLFVQNQNKLQQKKSNKSKTNQKKIKRILFSAFWQQHFHEECDRLREQTAQLQREYDEQSRSLSDRLETAATQNSDYLQVFNRYLF